jgi:hypothetical protein
VRAPKYYISLGGVNLHRVYAFRLTSGRDIESYDGIGSGKFNVPDAHNPREWTIDCELLQNGKETAGLSTWSASELFKEFEAWLGKTDAPVRMVKTDSLYPAANLSVLVWLKSYTKKESDEQGVYDTEIVVEEYKPVGIKTTGVPYVKRPGKAPVPKKVTITKKRTVYRTKKKYNKATLKSPKTGKTVKNPATVKASSVWHTGAGRIKETPPAYTGLLNTGIPINSRINYDAIDPWKKNVTDAFNSMGKKIKEWGKKAGSWCISHTRG